jgi:cytochrome oxidase Cu insertion factor (SCO1/SenC/PrrC family)
VLRAYGNAYGANSNHWSFLVTSPENTARLARLFGLNYAKEGGTINHDFRTAIVDAAGELQTVWPIGGDTTDLIVSKLREAATNAVSKSGPRAP